MVYIYNVYINVYINTILPSHKKEWNLAICNHMDGSWGYYAMWNESKTDTEWFHLYVEYKQMKNKWTKQNW